MAMPGNMVAVLFLRVLLVDRILFLLRSCQHIVQGDVALLLGSLLLGSLLLLLLLVHHELVVGVHEGA